MFSCEICEIFRNSYFEEYLQTTASINKWPLHSVLNIPEYALAEFCLFLRFLICQDSAYGRVLNMQDLYMVLNISQYGWIYLNRTWICLNMSEFTIIDRILNMYHTLHSARSLCKLLSTYLEIFRGREVYSEPWQRAKTECFGKIIIVFKYFSKKNSIFNFWESSEYVSGFKYARVLNIYKFSWIWLNMAE